MCSCYHCVKWSRDTFTLPLTSQSSRLCFCQTSAWTLSSFPWMWGLLDPNEKQEGGLSRGEGSDRRVNALRCIIKLTTPAPFRAISNSLKKFSSSFPSMYPFPERRTDYAITTDYQGSRFSFADMQKPHRRSCARGVKKIPAQLNVAIDSNMSLLPVTHPCAVGQYIGLLTNMMQTDHSSSMICCAKRRYI